jgi:hypothetical protein
MGGGSLGFFSAEGADPVVTSVPASPGTTLPASGIGGISAGSVSSSRAAINGALVDEGPC